MNVSVEGQQRADAFLAKLRAGLRGIEGRDADEIVEELRSHILERAAASGEVSAAAIDKVTAALGDPSELAREYVTDSLLARAEHSRTPTSMLASLFRWATLSFVGFFVFIGAVGGYFVGGALALCALLKPLHPATAGLWTIPSGGDTVLSLRLGFGAVPVGGHELLGWWMVPIGLFAGCVLLLVTTKISHWFVRQARKSLELPRAH